MDFDAKMTMFHAQAERHVEAGEIDQALAMFIWLVDRVPSDFRHRMRIAEVLHQLGEDGMSSEVLQAVARQSAMCGRLMRTVAACKRGLALFPDQREDFEALLVRLHRRATRQDLLPLPPEDEDVEVVAP